MCVVGDLMLDTYVWGAVSRVSPEGPIPVVHVDRRDRRPGGAGSVAAMLCALGAEALVVGVIGDDPAGASLMAELERCGADTSGVVTCADRPTTVKTRVMGYVQSAGRAVQQIVRVDEEQTDPVGAEPTAAVLGKVHDFLSQGDLVLIQDMAKGLLNGEVLRKLIADVRAAGKPVLVDPERGEDYSRYGGATCLLPNRFEAQTASGVTLDGPEAYSRAAHKFISELSLGSVVIKLDREGIFYATADGEQRHIVTRGLDVADVTGAGDMVAAVVALATAAGAPLEQAVELANVAAGVEVSRHGIATVSRAELIEELEAGLDPALRKIKTREELKDALARRRRSGQRIAMANGCFDLLHLGHVELVRFARRQADCLVVAINSDRSVRELKGPGRPVNDEAVRARILASLSDVDYVVLFDEVSVQPLIEEVRPDVLVKGGDYDRSGVVGGAFVESYGGEVKLAPRVDGLSTSELIRRIARNNEGRNPGNP